MTSAQAVGVLCRLRKLAASPSDTASDAQLLARFTAGQDPSAFAGLVARHGPMVLGVCRSVLHNWHDAEDAFQATFLVLARKASSICKAESLAGWLYGVAYRAALRARGCDARRRAREQRAPEMSSPDPLLDMTVREVREVLHEELQRLPEKYRAPLVLCYLEGLSQEAAAGQLGWSVGTTRGRLDRGRDQLRKRLARRGLSLSAVLGAAALGPSPVSAALTASVVRAATGAASDAVSAKASALAEGVIHTMFSSKIKTATALLLVAALLTAGTGWLVHAAAAPKRSTAAPGGERAKNDAGKGDKGTATFAGRVLDPDGKPVAKARVYVTRYAGHTKATPKALAVTGKAGQFHFTVPKTDPKGLPVAAVFAMADGFGPAWAMGPSKGDDVTLRLVKDDVPVSGRILNLEGKPVAGVRIQVRAIKAPNSRSLTPWLADVKKRATADGMTLDYQHLPMFHADELPGLFPVPTTGPDGRFTLTGIGRERVVALLIEGPTIETMEINVLTRPGVPAITLPWWRNAPELGTLTYYPARFEHAAAPCRPVTGTVRDKATGKPLAGATVRSERGVGNPYYRIQTTTDASGRYRLTGLPAVQPRRGLDVLVAAPPEGQARLSMLKRVEGKGRLEPATVDFDLAPGVWVEGRVTDKATGEGVEATLGYFAFADDTAEVNPRGVQMPEGLKTDKQGRFRFIAVPGRALLGARVTSGPKTDHYCIGAGADKIGGAQRFGGVKGVRGMWFRTVPHYANPWNHDVLAEIKPGKGADKVTCDLVLDPGLSQKVRILGPDGKPLAGTRVAGQFARESFHPVKDAEFTVYGLTAGEPRFLMFQHEGKKLSGLVELKAAGRGPIEVKLQASGTVSGRLVDAEGRPMRHADVTIYSQRDGDPNVLHDHYPRNVVTDAKGLFRIGNLVPGIRYLAHVRLKGKMYPGDVFRDLSVKAGESRDLGDVKPRTRDE